MRRSSEFLDGLTDRGQTMPKQKTHKGLRKRVKVTARGRIKFKPANAGHLMSGKSGNRRRRLRRKTVLQGTVRKSILRALGCEGAERPAMERPTETNATP